MIQQLWRLIINSQVDVRADYNIQSLLHVITDMVPRLMVSGQFGSVFCSSVCGAAELDYVCCAHARSLLLQVRAFLCLAHVLQNLKLSSCNMGERNTKRSWNSLVYCLRHGLTLTCLTCLKASVELGPFTDYRLIPVAEQCLYDLQEVCECVCHVALVAFPARGLQQCVYVRACVRGGGGGGGRGRC